MNHHVTQDVRGPLARIVDASPLSSPSATRPDQGDQRAEHPESVPAEPEPLAGRAHARPASAVPRRVRVFRGRFPPRSKRAVPMAAGSASSPKMRCNSATASAWSGSAGSVAAGLEAA
jgi:hypothetical protein